MQLTELLQRRLKIALNAAQNDPANTDSMKTVLSVLTQSLWHHSTALELTESQLASKVGDAEFKRALSGKLSVKEFLGYFQKIEKVVQKMQNYWSSNEQKTAQLLERQNERLKIQLGDTIQSRVFEIGQKIQDQQNKIRCLDEMKQKIKVIQAEIYETNKRIKVWTQKTIKKESNHKQQLEQDKMKTVLIGLREIQTFFNETHYQMKSLLESLIQSGGEKIAAPTQNSHRFQVLDMRIIRCEEVLPHRWIWNWNSHEQFMNWESRAGRKNIMIEKIQENIGRVLIKCNGFYKITIGYLMDPQSFGVLKLACNNRLLCTIQLERNNSSNLCKTTMLYSWIPNNGAITIQLQNSNNCQGFLEIQNFE